MNDEVKDMSSPPQEGLTPHAQDTVVQSQAAQAAEEPAVPTEVKEDEIKAKVVEGMLSAEDLVAGSKAEFNRWIDTPILKGYITVRALNMQHSQKARKAADSQEQYARYLLKQGVVKPKLSDDACDTMPIGVVNAINDEINKASGLKIKKGDVPFNEDFSKQAKN